MKPVVLLNGRSGANASTEDEESEAAVAAALRTAGVDADVRTVPGDQLQAEARAAVERGAPAVIAGGGDGTVSAVAAALARTDVPLGVLPLGTLNHFTKDAGIPLDLAGAAETIACGHVAAVDVGRLNDRIFLNNSSLGAYAETIVDRDRQRESFGRGKWHAMARAVLKTLHRRPLVAVRIEAEGQSQVLRTPLVFVGNNRYQLDLLNVGKRACLDQGELSLYLATAQSRLGMVELALRAATGRLEQSRDFSASCVRSVRIDSHRSELQVALDGEVVRLRPPLEYSIWPGALKVFVPQSSDNT